MGFAGGLAGVGLAGAGLNAAGSYMGMQAQSQAAAYQAAVARNNADTARENASFDSAAGNIAATNVGLRTRARVGAQIADAGAAGVESRTGSEAAVVGGIRQMGMQDAETVRSNAAKRAWGDEVQATSFQNQATLDTFESGVASTMAPLAAAGTFLSGASTVGGNFLKASQWGV